MKKRVLSMFMAFVLWLSLMPVTALAEESVSSGNQPALLSDESATTKPELQYRYIRESICEDRTVTEYEYLTADTTTLTEDVYVVKGAVEIDGNVTAENSNVSIILCDGASLTIKGSLSAFPSDFYTGLAIYGQEKQSGEMTIENETGYAFDYVEVDNNTNPAWIHICGG